MAGVWGVLVVWRVWYLRLRLGGAEGDEVCGLLFSSMGMDREDGYGCTFFAKARLSRHVERRSCVLCERLVGG